MQDGCDGVTLFGTTGEGAEFSVADRTATLEQVIAAGVPANRIIVSVGALSIPDIVTLSRHAIDQKVDGLLLMPPCVYRGGITDDGAFRFYASVIDAIARPDLRLYLYHFPDICGVPVTPNVVRRLDERYPGRSPASKIAAAIWILPKRCCGASRTSPSSPAARCMCRSCSPAAGAARSAASPT